MIKPQWLRKPPAPFAGSTRVRGAIARQGLHTVCRQARCPNMGQCYSRGTATFLILGDVCSRNCGFCAIGHGKPGGVADIGEPERVAQAAAELGLGHVVVTSVTRDDLPDGGAAIFAATIGALKARLPGATLEVLTPDFAGNMEAVDTVATAGPDVFNHNMETVRQLYGVVRPQGDYERSLQLLAHIRRFHPGVIAKSGFMLGLGETMPQVERLMGDLVHAGCQVATIGQYLAPSKNHLQVAEYIRPEVFGQLSRLGEQMGFAKVFAGPFVRSSYMAGELLKGALVESSSISAEEFTDTATRDENSECTGYN